MHRIGQGVEQGDHTGSYYAVSEVDDTLDEILGTLQMRTARVADQMLFRETVVAKLQEALDVLRREMDGNPSETGQLLARLSNIAVAMDKTQDVDALRRVFASAAPAFVGYVYSLQMQYLKDNPEEDTPRSRAQFEADKSMLQAMAKQFAKRCLEGRVHFHTTNDPSKQGCILERVAKEPASG